MSARPLLVELFTEELPPKALKRLGEAFAAAVADGLRARGLAGADARCAAFARRAGWRCASPRSPARPPIAAVEVKGPSVKVGLDAAGVPTQALLKWAEKQGVAVGSLARASDGKQECFCAAARSAARRSPARSRR